MGKAQLNSRYTQENTHNAALLPRLSCNSSVWCQTVFFLPFLCLSLPLWSITPHLIRRNSCTGWISWEKCAFFFPIVQILSRSPIMKICCNSRLAVLALSNRKRLETVIGRLAPGARSPRCNHGHGRLCIKRSSKLLLNYVLEACISWSLASYILRDGGRLQVWAWLASHRPSQNRADHVPDGCRRLGSYFHDQLSTFWFIKNRWTLITWT